MTQPVIEQILDQARWAPSGDNTQPWRFEIKGPLHVVVHGSDTRRHCVYDLDGHASQLSHGALLETLSIAASCHGLRADIRRRSESDDEMPLYEIRLITDPEVLPDPLAAVIEKRTVQRRALSTRPLTPGEMAALEASVGEGYRIHWLTGFGARLRTALLMFRNAHLRLTLPEAFETHRRVIEWKARNSMDRVPDQALGVDAFTAGLMRWVMQSWRRVDFFNTWLAGTLAPRLQMDLLPGIACAAHFMIVARRLPQGVDDYLAAGRALQRFWLTATQLGLQLQPEMTPLIFGRYARSDRHFSCLPHAMEEAHGLAERLRILVGESDAQAAVFMGRIGSGPAPRARSLRLPLERLMQRLREPVA